MESLSYGFLNGAVKSKLSVIGFPVADLTMSGITVSAPPLQVALPLRDNNTDHAPVSQTNMQKQEHSTFN